MMNNMKLGFKIGIQLAVLILVMVVMGMIAVIQMKTVSDESRIMGEEFLPQVGIFAEMEREIFHIRINDSVDLCANFLFFKLNL